jgi:23S rRNA (cytidine1920-2'-O)/16S rRNA (cytidine1409-2'-O)-methyltransferase
MSERLDKYMVDKELVKTRSQARMLIKQGDVYCNDFQVLKPGKLVSDTDVIKIKSDSIYVSRGAYKLLRAIEAFDLDFSGKVVADCGASTGGFTQVALQSGAAKVFAIDVGHDQLDEVLKQDTRVINFEGINLKNNFILPEPVDICVADLSFISIKKVYPTIKKLLTPQGYSIILIKPQFEAGRERLGKGGIVKAEHQETILEEVLAWFRENSFMVEKVCESPIKGKTGNQEYLALIR